VTELTCALGPDAAGTMLSRLVRGVRHRLDVAVYEAGPAHRWELVEAARRRVPVRLVLDAHASDGNAATARELIAAGGGCRVAGRGAEVAHGKLLIGDRTVAVGTGNLIWRDAPRDRHLRYPPGSTPLAGTREWWVAVSGSRALSRAAGSAFEQHWCAATAPPRSWSAGTEGGAPHVGIPIPRMPPDVASVRSRRLRLVTGGAPVGALIRSMIATARRHVLVTVPYAHTSAARVADLLDLMAGAASRGVACALLLGDVPDAGDAERLRTLPFAVRRMDPARSTSGHAKGVVADRSVLVSSANWSSSGLGENWEVALHVEHPGAAAYYAAAWRRDWVTGVAIDV
jgi:phosphatidylserine/phosphatidylglycerophosphate/cardiolipin synthase-like enzyme